MTRVRELGLGYGNETCGFGPGGAVGQLLSGRKGNIKKHVEEESAGSRKEGRHQPTQLKNPVSPQFV